MDVDIIILLTQGAQGKGVHAKTRVTIFNFMKSSRALLPTKQSCWSSKFKLEDIPPKFYLHIWNLYILWLSTSQTTPLTKLRKTNCVLPFYIHIIWNLVNYYLILFIIEQGPCWIFWLRKYSMGQLILISKWKAMNLFVIFVQREGYPWVSIQRINKTTSLTLHCWWSLTPSWFSTPSSFMISGALLP